MSDTTNAAALDMPPLEYTIELRRPIQHGGGTITEMRLRPPKGGEVRLARNALSAAVNAVTAWKHDMQLLAKVTGIPETALDDIDVDQINEAMAYLGFFQNASPRTGWNSRQN